MNLLEIAANAFVAVAIFLAGRNNVHTWWTGIVGCTLFGYVFYGVKLYADVTLQVFFVLTSIAGWYRWLRGNSGQQLDVRFSPPSFVALCAGLAAVAAAGTGRCCTVSPMPTLRSWTRWCSSSACSARF